MLTTLGVLGFAMHPLGIRAPLSVGPARTATPVAQLGFPWKKPEEKKGELSRGLDALLKDAPLPVKVLLAAPLHRSTQRRLTTTRVCSYS